MLTLVHRKSHENLLSGQVWKTCLRQIQFNFNDQTLNSLETHNSDEVYSDESALVFLMEVLCGLDSPIVGETEVFGQFKIFLEENNINSPLLQFVLKEVKSIRAEHLIGIGAQSYGSLLRKHTKSFGKISIIGAGHLVQEILPWVSHKNEIRVHTRDQEKGKKALSEFKKVVFSPIEKADLNEALVIAAPISNSEIQKLLKESNVKFVYDLRGESAGIETSIPKMELSDFFAEINSKKEETQKIVSRVRQIIKVKVHDYMNRMDHRPKGWDDLFS